MKLIKSRKRNDIFKILEEKLEFLDNFKNNRIVILYLVRPF